MICPQPSLAMPRTLLQRVAELLETQIAVAPSRISVLRGPSSDVAPSRTKQWREKSIWLRLSIDCLTASAASASMQP
eukprot:472492-Hanusia_phi.AAC.5